MTFSVFLFFHLLLEVGSHGKQKNILFCFSEMDVDMKNNREEYILWFLLGTPSRSLLIYRSM